MKKFIKESWLVLVMGIVFALLLAGTQTTLQGRINENKTKALNEAIANVVPNVASADELDIEGNKVFKCLGADKQIVGWAIQAAGTGFVDKITLVVGLSADAATITGLKVIDNVETPGLGNKIASTAWPDQYKQLDATRAVEVIKGTADKSNNEIQAITGATWSSRYVTDIVNDVANRVRPKLAEHR